MDTVKDAPVKHAGLIWTRIIEKELRSGAIAKALIAEGRIREVTGFASTAQALAIVARQFYPSDFVTLEKLAAKLSQIGYDSVVTPERASALLLSNQKGEQ
jgi:hypothetical protein